MSCAKERLISALLSVVLLAGCGGVDADAARHTLADSRREVNAAAIRFSARIATFSGGVPHVRNAGFEMCSGAPEYSLAVAVDITMATPGLSAKDLEVVIVKSGGTISGSHRPLGVMPQIFYVKYPGGGGGIWVRRGVFHLSTAGDCIRVTKTQANTY